MTEAVVEAAASHPRKPIGPDHLSPLPIVVVVDREGMVIGVLAGRVAARAFLREGAR